MIFEAFKKLTNAINMARLATHSQTFGGISKHLDHLYIDSKYAYNLDNPSIKTALCAFLIDKEPSFVEQKQEFYRFSQYIIFYLNNYIIDHPSERLFSSTKNEERYKDFYNRWLACVVLPGTFRTYVSTYQQLGQHH